MTIATGTLRGNVSAQGRSFMGIPYAAPPTGALRFRRPQPALPWQGVRDATQPAASCPQNSALLATSEDCLFLNVHTPPSAESAKLPVMVWFHGGGYFWGAGADYDPTPLVSKGKAIVVTVNYRLQALGFLALPQLAAESNTAGNYGILDQQASLRWVRDNIGAFGGDPGNVTIFGESSGGHSVCMQLISPGARGLFHRAIMESGTCVNSVFDPHPAPVAYARGASVAASVGCTDPATQVACMRGKPVDQLLRAGTQPNSWRDFWFTPTIDRTVIKEPTSRALSSGRYSHVPILSGSNREEGRLFVATLWHQVQGRSATEPELREEIRALAGEVTPEMLAAYPPESPGNADVAVSRVITDARFACAALFTSRAVLPYSGPNVYEFEFTDPNPPYSKTLDPTWDLAAYHTSEMYYLFKVVMGLPTTGLDGAQTQLSNQMIKYWTTFARTGDPNGAGSPTWPPYTAASEQIQRLDPQRVAPFTTFSVDHECGLWG
ncbi:carboxylesterase family protein [Spirillospora sp. NBC_00431]